VYIEKPVTARTKTPIEMLRTIAGSMIYINYDSCSSIILRNITKNLLRFIIGDSWHSGLGWERSSNPLTLSMVKLPLAGVLLH